MPPLRVLGSRDEVLLFSMLGIEQYQPDEPCALLLGRDDMAPVQDIPCVRLPDTENPMRETERLAEALGRAVGQGSVRP